MAKTNSMQRTLKALRSLGFEPKIVEKFNRFAGKFGQREDLFEIFDIVAYGNGIIVGVQACGNDFALHDRKILNSEHGKGWLKNGGEIHLWGWTQIKNPDGGKRKIWRPRLKYYTLEDFNNKGNVDKNK